MDQLPDRVKGILGGPLREKRRFCSFCHCTIAEADCDATLMSSETIVTFGPSHCDRCQIAQYCSPKCQRDHSKFHDPYCTRLCSLVSKLRNSHHDALSTIMTKVQVGDCLVKMGYHENAMRGPVGVCHERQRRDVSTIYCQRALQCYLECLVDESLRHQSPKVEERVLFLLVLMGGDAQVMLDWGSFSAEWTTTQQNDENSDDDESDDGDGDDDNFLPNDDSKAQIHHPLLALHGMLELDCDREDCTFAALYLLACLRCLAEHEQTKKAFQTYQDMVHSDTISNGNHNDPLQSASYFPPQQLEAVHGIVSSFLWGNDEYAYGEALPAEISRVVQHLETSKRNGSSFLRALIADIPKKPWIVPSKVREFFAAGTLNYDVLGGIEAPRHVPEFWLLYQECFMSIPGGVDILEEFLAKDDDAIKFKLD